jgi:sec-independent protein translocase protein TatA
MMFEGLFQPMHLLVILALCVLIFGPKKLPELGKGLGEGIRGFRDGMKDHAKSTGAETAAAETKDEVK